MLLLSRQRSVFTVQSLAVTAMEVCRVGHVRVIHHVAVPHLDVIPWHCIGHRTEITQVVSDDTTAFFRWGHHGEWLMLRLMLLLMVWHLLCLEHRGLLRAVEVTILWHSHMRRGLP